MSITSFDHFIETLENVPSELQRNFNLMTDLDKRTSEVMTRINECVRDYRKSCKKDERMILYKESIDLFDKARCFADDKVELAMQTYDLVDKHIRSLEGLSGAQLALATSATSTNKSNDVNKTSNSKVTKKDQDQDKAAASKNVEPITVDMPLDPNEPRYCTCHQVSFGEMIACDNKDCPIEWFHFACVDLKVKPNGKWYCPECFNINKKGKHKFKKQKT